MRIGFYIVFHSVILLAALWLSDYAIRNHRLYHIAHGRAVARMRAARSRPEAAPVGVESGHYMEDWYGRSQRAMWGILGLALAAGAAARVATRFAGRFESKRKYLFLLSPAACVGIWLYTVHNASVRY